MARSVLIVIMLLAAAGCGSEFGATVSGKVTLDGKPVHPGYLTFAAESAEAFPAVSDLGADGSYELTTNRKAGAVPGPYRVAVQAFKAPEGVAPGERSFKPSVPLVPSKYLDVTTSGLQFTVEPGSNTIDIELTSDGASK